jgi:PAS domain S-box-containing protein
MGRGRPFRFLKMIEVMTENSEIAIELLDNSPDAMMALSPEGTVVYWNKGAENTFGYTRKEAIGRELSELIIPPDPGEEEEKFRKKVMDSGYSTFESFRKKKDGSLIHVDISTRVIRDDQGSVKYILSTKRDITDRKRAEERFRLVVEAAPSAMLMVDAQGRMTLANSQVEQLFGYTRAELLDKAVEMLVPERYRAIHSGHRTHFFQHPSNRAMGAGRELYGRRKDGSEVPIEIGLNPVKMSEGTFVLASIIDITERKLIEEARHGSELRYRRLFESAKDGILILDAVSGQIVDVNPYLIELLGISKEELAGQKLWEIGPFKDIVASKLAFAELQERGYIRYENLPLLSREGLIRHVEVVSNTYLAGESLVIQCNIRDITERKLAEEDLRKTNQSLEGAVTELQTKTVELASMTQQLWQASKLATMGELAASIAHELNNPLATVALRAEALMEGLPPDDPRFISVQIISQEVERMASLVGNLLKFSRRSLPAISTLDMREELEHSLEFIEHYLSGHNVDVVRDFASELPDVHADRQQLRQVFLNLITNASDAMPRGGTLTIRAFSGVLGGRSVVIVELSDTGTGVKSGDLPKLWEPFFTTKPEGKGTGLGLAICRRTVEEHHGIIDIETSPGKGATVRITLPAADTGENKA